MQGGVVLLLGLRAQEARFRYCSTAEVSTTAAKTARKVNGLTMSARPAPLIRIAREMATKCRTGFSSAAVCAHGAMLSIGVNSPLINM